MLYSVLLVNTLAQIIRTQVWEDVRKQVNVVEKSDGTRLAPVGTTDRYKKIQLIWQELQYVVQQIYTSLLRSNFPPVTKAQTCC